MASQLLEDLEPFESTDFQKGVDQLVQLAELRSFTLGFAESCTGGHLSALLARFPGVSRIFLGSVVSYHASIKVGVLGVDPNCIKTHGEVSEVVARQMAQGAKKVLGVDWSVAITGIAGPSGGTAAKPVGTVCFAVVGPCFARAQRQQFDPNLSRLDIQKKSVLFALDFLLDELK